MRGHRSAVAAAGMLGALALAVAGCAGGSSRKRIRTSGTFVSLLRVCHLTPPRDRLLLGCVNGHYSLVVEQFSLSDGRRIRTIAPVPGNAETPAPLRPAGTRSGAVLLTAVSGPRCLKDGRPLKGVSAECRPSRSSCVNTVMELSAAHPTPTLLLTVSSDQDIGPVVPNPAGSEIAYSARPCVGTRPLPGLYIRDLRTGWTREIVRASYCSAVGQPVWNAAGSEVAYLLRASSERPVSAPIGSSGPSCSAPATAAARLVVSSARPPARRLLLISPAQGCRVASASFDAEGILVAEGCSTGHRLPPAEGATRGPAYLVQYSARGKPLTRIRLPYRGLDPEQTLVAEEPGSARMLITQDQPNGLVARDGDHVYELERTHLRQIVERSWGPDFIAVPW